MMVEDADIHAAARDGGSLAEGHEDRSANADVRSSAARIMTTTLHGRPVVLVATIQGLEGEARHVEAGLQALRERVEEVAVVAVGVPPEDVASLRRIGATSPEDFLQGDFDTGTYEENVLPHLARFGDVAVPPDDLVAAERIARETGARLAPLDLDDNEHADLFTACVGGLELLRSQMRIRRLAGGGLDRARSAEELVMAWDEAFTSLKGHGRVELAREDHMARRLHELAGALGDDPAMGATARPGDGARGRPGGLLAVIPLPRMRGVVGRLEAHAASEGPSIAP